MEDLNILSEHSTIAEAVVYLDSLKAEVAVVYSCLPELFSQLRKVGSENYKAHTERSHIVGQVSKETLKKAQAHHIESYPVSILLNYEEDKSPQVVKPSAEDVVEKYRKLFSEEVQKSIRMCTSVCKETGTTAYLIGGPVRDIFRNKQNLDVDITVEGNGIAFARKIAEFFEEVTLKEIHEEFGTAKCLFEFDDSKVEIDFASTRTETYEKPGALPTVQQTGCSIHNDLIRRDFTINAMAMDISEKNFGCLIDTLGGLNDLEAGVLRVIHSYSFIDDPTRIIRAMEFAVRFNYKLTSKTEKLIMNLIKSGLFDNYCNDRLKLESKPLLNLNNVDVMRLITEYSLQRLFSNSIQLNEQYTCNIELLFNNLKHFLPYIEQDKVWLIYLASMFLKLPDNEIESILNNLYMTNKEMKVVKESVELAVYLKKRGLPEKPSDIYDIFYNKENEAIAASIFLNNSEKIRNEITNYFSKYSQVRLETTGQKLIELGYKPGPLFSMILKDLLAQKINGAIQTPEQEIDYINTHYNK